MPRACAGPGHRWCSTGWDLTAEFSVGHGDTFNLQHVQLHYNSSYATARKAVRALIDDGTLAECRGGYHRSSHRVSPYAVTLAFVIAEKALEHTWMANNAETLMHEFERACSRANIKLHLSFWRFYPANSEHAIFPDFDSILFSDSNMGRSIAGFGVSGELNAPAAGEPVDEIVRGGAGMYLPVTLGSHRLGLDTDVSVALGEYGFGTGL